MALSQISTACMGVCMGSSCGGIVFHAPIEAGVADKT